MLKAKWIVETEDTDEARRLFAELFMEEFDRWAGKVLIYSCMLQLLGRKQNG